jgi:hypothetical protein
VDGGGRAAGGADGGDEQALEDLQLLIKLSYSDSYTHDDGQLLPLEMRLRLAVRAAGLEFV